MQWIIDKLITERNQLYREVSSDVMRQGHAILGDITYRQMTLYENGKEYLEHQDKRFAEIKEAIKILSENVVEVTVAPMETECNFNDKQQVELERISGYEILAFYPEENRHAILYKLPNGNYKACYNNSEEHSLRYCLKRYEIYSVMRKDNVRFIVGDKINGAVSKSTIIDAIHSYRTSSGLGVEFYTPTGTILLFDAKPIK